MVMAVLLGIEGAIAARQALLGKTLALDGSAVGRCLATTGGALRPIPTAFAKPSFYFFFQPIWQCGEEVNIGDGLQAVDAEGEAFQMQT